MALIEAIDRVFAIQAGMSASGHSIARVYKTMPDPEADIDTPCWINTDITWSQAQFGGGIAMSDYALRMQLFLGTDLAAGSEIGRMFLPIIEGAFVADDNLLDKTRQVTIQGGEIVTGVADHGGLTYAVVDVLLGLATIRTLEIT